MSILYIDFETRSTVNLLKTGVWVYARDSATSILCIAWALDDGPVRLWHCAHPVVNITESPPPTELFKAINDPSVLIEAHNASFERAIWHYQGQRLGWPAITDDRRWRCSAAKAAAHNLPRALGMAAKAMCLPLEKDDLGSRIMKKVSRPRTPTKKNPSLWNEDPDDLTRLWAYCRTDVATERLLSEQLRELIPQELEVFYTDMVINSRGIYCDMKMVGSALNIVAEEVKALNAELAIVTEGKVLEASKRGQFVDWMLGQGYVLLDTKGKTLETWIVTLKDDPTTKPKVIRALEICYDVNRTSTSKYQAMRLRACPDARLRGTLLYHGTATGRWSGRGVQPHNFPRGTISNMDLACEVVCEGSRDLIHMLYGNVMGFLSGTIRGALTAGSGKDLLGADYTAIEARVTLWYADEQEGLDVFRRDEDIYKFTAMKIYSAAYDEITSSQRFIGKQAVLGLGFGMGWKKFIEICANYGVTITEQFAKDVVYGYRDTYFRVINFWAACEHAAKECVLAPGRRIKVGRITYASSGKFLYCMLPSGRRLAYHKPYIGQQKTPWGTDQFGLCYWGVDQKTGKYCNISTYGGRLVENIVQATARDVMALAILKAEQQGYPVVLTVHDEVISEVDEGTKSLTEFESLLAENPGWADGLPIIAKGWRGKRYRK